jgi:hypothetical protein
MDIGYLSGDKAAGALISEFHVINCQKLSKTDSTRPRVGQGLWWTLVAVNANKVKAEGEVKYRAYLL